MVNFRTRIFIYFTVGATIILSSCVQDSNLENHFSKLCQETNYKIDIEEKSESLNTIIATSKSLLDLEKYKNLDTRISLIQEMIQSQVNLKVVPNYDSLINLKLIPDDQIELELFIRTNSTFNNDVNQAELNLIKKCITENKARTYQDLYNLTNLIRLLAQHYHDIHQQDKSFTALFFGLHKIESNKLSKNLSSLREALISDFIVYSMREENSLEYIETCQIITKLLTKEFESSFEGLLYKAYLAEEIDKFNDSNFYLKYLLKAKEQCKTKSDQNTIYHNLAYYYSKDSTRTDLSQEYYKKALEQYDNVVCNKNYFQLLLSILSNPLTNIEMSMYLDLLAASSDCDVSIQSYVDFVKPIYLAEANRPGTKYDKVAKLISESIAASNSFPGRSTLHLQDYYLSNLKKITNLFKQGELIPTKYHNSIINKFLEVRLRDIHRQVITDKNINSNKNRNSISKILLDLNNFKNIKNLNDPIYRKLFDLYILQEKNSVLETNFTMNSVDFNLLPIGSYTINFMRDSDKYMVYLLGGGTLRSYQYSTDVVDSVFLNYYQSYIEQKKDLFKDGIFIEIEKIVSGENINLIADGILIHLPPKAIFPSAKTIKIFSNLNQITEHNQVKILQNEINLLSYSSRQTLQSKKEKKYPELAFGLKEIKSISKILRSPIVKTGHEFQSKDIINTKFKLTHISTHAKSDPKSQLNNYILTNNESEKLYGFEFYRSGISVPKVVVLSACETGIGLPAYGAGVQTLSRAFLDNGTQTVIKTLWKVNEKATAEFMIQMYTYWVTGISLYDALEKTKNDFEAHKDYSHPYYWAGFVLEGNPHVYLDLSENNN